MVLVLVQTSSEEPRDLNSDRPSEARRQKTSAGAVCEPSSLAIRVSSFVGVATGGVYYAKASHISAPWNRGHAGFAGPKS